MQHKKILVLGVTGMLGSAVFKYFFMKPNIEVYGTLRSSGGLKYFSPSMHDQLITNIDLLNETDMIKAFQFARPDVVINCVGLVKQLSTVNDPLLALPINAILPHRLARLTELLNARLIHISTDCVFEGTKGFYSEKDVCDAKDLYGVSKKLGELNDRSNAITLRTSIIGHEQRSNRALIDWFLSQQQTVKGFKKAIYSGFPTVEIATIIDKYIIPNEHLSGLYHVSSEPIDKYTLLSIVAETYGKKINIEVNEDFIIDRSLDSTLFKSITGYLPPSWPDLIVKMKNFR